MQFIMHKTKWIKLQADLQALLCHLAKKHEGTTLQRMKPTIMQRNKKNTVKPRNFCVPFISRISQPQANLRK